MNLMKIKKISKTQIQKWLGSAGAYHPLNTMIRQVFDVGRLTVKTEPHLAKKTIFVEIFLPLKKFDSDSFTPLEYLKMPGRALAKHIDLRVADQYGLSRSGRKQGLYMAGNLYPWELSKKKV